MPFPMLNSSFDPISSSSKNQEKRKKIRGPPGPPGLPFIGNLHQFDSAKPHEYLWKLSKKYGPLMSLRLRSVPVVLIFFIENGKRSPENHDLVFYGRPAYVSHKKLSYNGLDVAFSPYGEYSRKRRKICDLHLFSLGQVQSFSPIIQDEISHLIQKISNLSCASKVINLSSIMMSLSSTIICRIDFTRISGHDGGFLISDFLPSLSWIDKLSGMFARLENNFKNLDLFYQELIDEHLNPNRPETMKDDVLDILIQIKQEQSSGFALSWDHIKALLMNIFIAGTESSAATVVWAMTALMKNPSALKKVQAEIRDLVGQRGAIVAEKLQQLHYLDAVITETVRLYPLHQS